MTKFKSKASEQYLKVVSALRGLADKDDIGSAFADAVQPVREHFERESGFTKAAGTQCIHRLLTSRHSHGKDCSPPGTDHPRLLKRDGKPSVFVSEPYDLDDATLRRMVAFADLHGLRFEIQPQRATHYPGWTMAVLWRPKRPTTADPTEG